LESGVQKVHFLNGKRVHSILLELFTDSGIGTEFISS
jgi:acetylglutamate kinase